MVWKNISTKWKYFEWSSNEIKNWFLIAYTSIDGSGKYKIERLNI